jgi:hypothetical protein
MIDNIKIEARMSQEINAVNATKTIILASEDKSNINPINQQF